MIQVELSDWNVVLPNQPAAFLFRDYATESVAHHLVIPGPRKKKHGT